MLYESIALPLSYVGVRATRGARVAAPKYINGSPGRSNQRAGGGIFSV